MGQTRNKKNSTNNNRHPYMTQGFWEKRLQENLSPEMQDRIIKIISEFRPQPNYLTK